MILEHLKSLEEQFKNRLTSAEKTLQQLHANYNVMEGSKNEVLFWLSQIADQIKKAEVETPQEAENPE